MSARARKLVVAGLILGGDGRVLITQRRADQSLPLQWEFPGGKVEPGEAPVAALARELAEELGVVVDRRADLGRAVPRLPGVRPGDAGLRVPLEPGQAPRAVEVADLAWVARGDLPGAWDILPADRPLIARLVAEGPPG